ncbi:hypothetical protein LZ198_26650 [Myxococcus sp. K15C18031901]|uniref:hypothetical protein n=1 Tax=Myxococcus dinghuensis TaxID=2906761 RepID=UPI0020A81034|nr:hypothetical protein [Myxococcus dinghuensis]MCP3102458.1 hypothetical protein [Myxococcus dinghuensis]
MLSARAEGAESAVQRQLAEAIRLYEDLDYELALKQLQKASVLPHDASEAVSILLLQGIVKAELGRWEEAREDFHAALNLQLDAELPLHVSPKVAREFEAQRGTARAAVVAQKPKDVPTAKAEPRPVLVPPPATQPAEPTEPEWAPSGSEGGGLALAGRRVPVLSMVLLGAGVAAGGVGTVFGLSSRSQVDEARAARTVPEVEDHHSKAQGSATAANVLFGTAVAAAVGAVTTWLVMGAPSESASVVAEETP